MPWLQITFDCHRDQVEAAEEALMAAGAVSVTLTDAEDQPLLEPAPGEMPLWDAARISGLFQAGADLDAVQNRVLLSLGLDRLPRLQLETLEDQDWERAWMDNFQPLRFGRRLWIVPSWHEAPDPGAVNIRLDPGLAFGTGTHPTTALCLEWLDAHPPEGLEVVDYGCGSGILALAAAKLGAARLWATDIDPQALQATRDNLEKNAIAADAVHTCLPNDLPDIETDLVLANILSGPLVELEPRLSALCRPGGWLVLSGILEEQADTVMQAYARHFDMQPPAFQEGWARLSGRRKTA